MTFEEDLARSGISPADARRAGMFAVENAGLVHSSFKPLPAFVIPYYDSHTQKQVVYGGDKPFFRVRYLPATAAAKAFVKPSLRYVQPAASGTFAYFPVVDGLAWPEVLADTAAPLLITEGEKKALAGCLAGFNVIGLGGVFNFLRGGALLPELANIAWSGRRTYLVFDSDAEHNPLIQMAEERLAAELGPARGARVHIARLPPRAAGGKNGLDDMLAAGQLAGLEEALHKARKLYATDEKVLQLNQHIAWIEQEGSAYELATGTYIPAGALTRGSRYSTWKQTVLGPKGAVKELKIADIWLSHPMARRYTQITFDPTTLDSVVRLPSGGAGLNLWKGFQADPGDVQPFLDLHAYVFGKLPQEHRDFALRLLAYKAQHPGTKVPLSIVLVGREGSGKSLWADCARQAFAPYGADVDGDVLAGVFNGWVESSLLAVFDEVDPAALSNNKSKLRKLISATTIRMNEKFRVSRDVKSYTMYILTANPRAVGSYGAGDRRMFVVDCPDAAAGGGLYARCIRWLMAGGAKHLMHWLLSMDLQGWEPPLTAPETSEKYMAYMEGLTPVQRVAEEMRTADQHVVVTWIDAALSWARTTGGVNAHSARLAQEVEASLGQMPIRPWYTPEELVKIFPLISTELHGVQKLGLTAAGALSRELRDAGIPYLLCTDSPRGFRWRGRLGQYLVIADPAIWGAPLSQGQFDEYMGQFPTYAELRKALKKA